MKIIALGTGSAFTLKNRQTNFLIERDSEKLLIDCGSDIRWSLKDHAISPLEIDGVYISHAHADHAGGLEYLGFVRYFQRDLKPLPTLFCEENLVKSIWEHTLKGGMQTLEGIEATLETYFNVVPVVRNSHFIWNDIAFDIVQSIHISSKYSVVDSFGVMFTDRLAGKRIFITTDVQFAPETSMRTYYNEADVIIHDCETTPGMSGVHAHYSRLKTLDSETKKKMILVHYQDNVLDDWEHWQSEAKQDGFCGFINPGLVYES